MSTSEIGGLARDPKPGGRYALDDARHCRNMHRNGSDELRVGGDLTRFLARGARPLERGPRSDMQIARDLQSQPRSTPIRCVFSRATLIAGASRRDRAATREVTSWQSNPST